MPLPKSLSRNPDQAGVAVRRTAARATDEDLMGFALEFLPVAADSLAAQNESSDIGDSGRPAVGAQNACSAHVSQMRDGS